MNRTPQQIVDKLQAAWSSSRGRWLIGSGTWPYTFVLSGLTESQAIKDSAGVRAWVSSWQTWEHEILVRWEERFWPRMGRQLLPTRVEIESPDVLARIIGETARWRRACTRRDFLQERWRNLVGSPALARNFDILSDYPEGDFQRLVTLLAWLTAGNDTAVYLRQLPVPGLDTKWFEGRKGLVADLLAAVQGTEARDVYTMCGLVRPSPRVRMRVLCPILRATIGGLCDIEAPVSEIAGLSIRPSGVVIVENLVSGLALPDIPGAISFMKLGKAVSLLGSISWLKECRPLYWGDIDTHGFAILEHARRVFSEVTSILMTEEILLSYKDLWVTEMAPIPLPPDPCLSAQEADVFAGLAQNRWGQNIRLEQERLPWNLCLSTVRSALLSSV